MGDQNRIYCIKKHILFIITTTYICGGIVGKASQQLCRRGSKHNDRTGRSIRIACGEGKRIIRRGRQSIHRKARSSEILLERQSTARGNRR